jgi:hypothetical protein
MRFHARPARPVFLLMERRASDIIVGEGVVVRYSEDGVERGFLDPSERNL